MMQKKINLTPLKELLRQKPKKNKNENEQGTNPKDELILRIKRLEDQSSSLEESSQTRDAMTSQIFYFAQEFLTKLRSSRVLVKPAEANLLLKEAPITENGKKLREILPIFNQNVVEPGFNTASGQFMGYIPSGGLYLSALGDFLAATTNKFTGVFQAAPGGVRLEHQLIRWMAEMFG